MPETWKQWCWLVLVLIVALVLRVGTYLSILESPSRALTPDSSIYQSLADRISAGHGFVDARGRPEARYTPGYPILLSVANRLGAVEWLLAVQVLFDMLLVVATFGLTRRLINIDAAGWAIVFQAVSPIAIAASCRALPDSIFAYLLTGGIFFWVRAIQEERELSLIASALLLSAACYFNPLGLLVAGIIAAGTLFSACGVRRFLLLMCFLVVALGPWVVRNQKLADYYGFSYATTETLRHGMGAEIVAIQINEEALTEADQITVADARYALDQLVDRQALPTLSEEIQFRRAQAWELIREHPGQAVAIHLLGTQGFWLPGVADAMEVLGVSSGQKGTLDVFHQQGGRAAIDHYLGDDPLMKWVAGGLTLLFAVKFIGVITFIVTGVKGYRDVTSIGWTLALVVIAVAVANGPLSVPGMRVCVAPLLSVAAGAGWMRLFRWRHRDDLPAAKSWRV